MMSSLSVANVNAVTGERPKERAISLSVSLSLSTPVQPWGMPRERERERKRKRKRGGKRSGFDSLSDGERKKDERKEREKTEGEGERERGRWIFSHLFRHQAPTPSHGDPKWQSSQSQPPSLSPLSLLLLSPSPLSLSSPLSSWCCV
jgi:hypothetical protein